MKRLPLWWLPLLLLIAPVMGRAPMPRDVADYFAPMRRWSATTLNAGEAPWLNSLNGCGEPWFANPQTAVLAPSLVPHLVLPPAWALTLEIALHLAWLSLGVGLLARQWGAEGPGRSVAELAACTVGPVLSLVGLLSNLETLAWAPWLVLAASLAPPRQVPLTALAVAGAWLGGDPQLCALSMALALAAAARRSTALLGMGLGLAIVSVQAIPFAALVLEGDRGSAAAAWVLPGALAPFDLLGLLAPVALEGSRGTVYLPSLLMGAPLMLLAGLGMRRHPRVAVVLLPLVGIAMLPAVGGESLYLMLTRGLVRFPSRFAILAWTGLLPLIGLGVRPWLDGRSRLLAVVVGALGLVASVAAPFGVSAAVAALAAALVLVAASSVGGRRLRTASLLVGLVVPLAGAAPLLELRRAEEDAERAQPWPEARLGGRVYTVLPTQAEEVQDAQRGLDAKRRWPMGYLNLDLHLALIRSPAAVINRDVAMHVEAIDRGPQNRWWLDVIGARWLVLPPAAATPEGFEIVREKEGFRLLRNPRSLPTPWLTQTPLIADQRPTLTAGALTLRSSTNTLEIGVHTPAPSVLTIAVAPVRGWRWRVEGRPVEARAGPGAVQSLAVGVGTHHISGRYRPPGLAPGIALSLFAVVMTAILLWRSRRPRADLPGAGAQGGGAITRS